MSNQNLGKGPANTERPKFTVITVGLNVEKTIEKTISSVLEQTLSPYEYFVIDGLSADGTVKIAKKYEKAFKDKGIKYTIISEKDTSACAAMNKGIRLSTGDFISFLNADDWYEPDALQNISSFYEQEPFDLTYGGLHYIMPDGKVVNKMSRMDHFPISTRNWNHPSMFMRREIYLKYNFDENMSSLTDFDVYLAVRRDGYKIRVIDKIITNYVAGGYSNDPDLRLALRRASNKYKAYRSHGYSWIYWIEAYGWEFIKNIYMRLHTKK